MIDLIVEWEKNLYLFLVGKNDQKTRRNGRILLKGEMLREETQKTIREAEQFKKKVTNKCFVRESDYKSFRYAKRKKNKNPKKVGKK